MKTCGASYSLRPFSIPLTALDCCLQGISEVQRELSCRQNGSHVSTRWKLSPARYRLQTVLGMQVGPWQSAMHKPKEPLTCRQLCRRIRSSSMRSHRARWFFTAVPFALSRAALSRLVIAMSAAVVPALAASNSRSSAAASSSTSSSVGQQELLHCGTKHSDGVKFTKLNMGVFQACTWDAA